MLKKFLIITLSLVIVTAVSLLGVMTYNEIRYPLKYQEEVKIFSEKYNLEVSLVNSIINAESRFNKDAVSRCGAAGLMQLMPTTAVWLADEIGMEHFRFESLYEPAVNIEMGTYYFRYLLDKFGDVDLALAAYNAGEGNVSRWLNTEEYSKDGRLTEIPYKETRDYVSKINRFNKAYKGRLNTFLTK